MADSASTPSPTKEQAQKWFDQVERGILESGISRGRFQGILALEKNLRVRTRVVELLQQIATEVPRSWLGATDLQLEVPLDIRVVGCADWKEAFQRTVKLMSPRWIEWCGGTEVPVLHYLRKEAEINDVSFERSVVCDLLTCGFQFEEFEFEYGDGGSTAWGKCVWYKEHPSYVDPPTKAVFKTRFLHNLNDAVVRTEHAGDQRVQLFSAQMVAQLLQGRAHILLDKKLVYHKVVFSPPKVGKKRTKKS